MKHRTKHARRAEGGFLQVVCDVEQHRLQHVRIVGLVHRRAQQSGGISGEKWGVAS